MDIQNILDQAKQRGQEAIDSIKKRVSQPQKSGLQTTYETYQRIKPVIGAVQGIAKGFNVEEQLPTIFKVPVTGPKTTALKEYAERVTTPLGKTVEVLQNKPLTFAQKLQPGKTTVDFISGILGPFDAVWQGLGAPVLDTALIELYKTRKSLGLPTIDIPGGVEQYKRTAITGVPTEQGRTNITLNEALGVAKPVKPAKFENITDELMYQNSVNRYETNRFLNFLPEALFPGPGELISAVGAVKPLKEVNPKTIKEGIKIYESLGEVLDKSTKEFIENTFKSVDDIKNYIREQVGGLTQISKEDKNLITKSQELATYVKEQKAIREASRGKPTSIKEKLTRLWDDYKFNFETQQEQIYKTLKNVEQKYGELKPSENPIYKLGLLYKASKTTEDYLKTNGFYNIVEEANKIGSGDEFGQLLHDRRLLRIAKEEGTSFENMDKAQSFVSETLPKYKDLVQKYDNFMSGLLRNIFDNGLITKEEYIRLKELKDYAPFQKVFSEVEQTIKPQVGTLALGSVTDPKLVQKTQDIFNTIHENPLESTIYYTYRAMDAINQNKFAKSFGNLIKEGKIEGAEMLRVAEDVLRRKALIEDVEQLKKVRDAVKNIVRKKKIQVGVLEKELNQLARRGINLSLTKTSTETIDPVLLDRLKQKIKILSKDKEKLFKELKQLELKDLELQDNKAYFGFESGLPKPQTQAILDQRVVKKEQFLLKTLFKTDALVKEKVVKYLNKNYGLFFNKMTDKQLLDFFRNTSPDELETFVELAFNLTPKQYDSFIKKLTASKSKEAQVLLDIDNAKNEAFTNKIVTSLYSNEQDLIKKYVKVSDNLKSVLSEIDKAKANIYYNDLFNSLVKKSPEELEIINKQLTKKEKNIKAIVETITNGQKKLDEVTGYIKQREEEIRNLQEVPKNGKATISWINNGVREIAEVSPELAKSFQVANDLGATNKILEVAGKGTQAWKTNVVGLNPVSQTRQFIKNQNSLLFFANPRGKLSVINPINFLEAVFGMTGDSSPALRNYLRKAPLIGDYLDKQAKLASQEYKRFIKMGGGQSTVDSLKRDNVKNFVENGKKLSFLNPSTIEKKVAYLEELDRFRLFRIQKAHYLRQGYSVNDAELKAVFDSNNLLPNYLEKGSYSRVLEIASVFVNSKLKSGRALRRYIAEKPGEATFSILTTVAMPTVAITYWNMSDEKRRQAYLDIPDWKKEVGNIILPPNPEKDAEGNWVFDSVLQEETIAGLAQGFRRATELAMSENPDKVKEFLSGTLDTTHDIVLSTTGQDIPLGGSLEKASETLRQNFSTMNPVVGVPAQLLGGFDLFTGTPIESKSDEKKYPYERFSPKTSLLARDLGKFLFDNGVENISPKEIQFFIDKGYPGIPQYAVTKIDDLRTAVSSGQLPENYSPKRMFDDILKIFKTSASGEEVKKIFKEQEKADWEKAKQNAGTKELIKELSIGNSPEDTLKKLQEIAPNYTQAQFRQLENAVQKELLEETLTPDQKIIFNFTDEELNKVASDFPNKTSDVETIKQTKEILSKEKNMSLQGFKFKSVPGQGGGISVKIGKPKSIKLGKIKKPRGIRLPKAGGIKKVSIKKPKQIKQPKFAKVKPLKKIKRL